MKVSIIIPFKNLDDYVRECVGKCLSLKGDFEIILLPDVKIKEKFPGTRVFVNSGKPSVKRNFGVSKAKGSVIAFIDSDAYPEKDWLKNALKYLKEYDVVGGPNITPDGDTRLQKASGDILSSSVMVGKFSSRYKRRKEGFVKELPSCNLFIKKGLFEEVGGFDVSLLTAEDAKLCFMASNLGKKIYYAPDVAVFHHRRQLFVPHLKQMFVYGRDKAVLLRQGFKGFYYFIPSLFVIYVFLGLVLSLLFGFSGLYLISIALYLFIMLAASLSINWKRFHLIFVGGVLTHFAYGFGFLRGLRVNKSVH